MSTPTNPLRGNLVNFAAEINNLHDNHGLTRADAISLLTVALNYNLAMRQIAGQQSFSPPPVPQEEVTPDGDTEVEA